MSDFSRFLSGFSRSFGFVRSLGFPPSCPSSFHPSRCRLVFSHGSSPSGITFLHRFCLPSPAPALSLSLPHFLRCYSLSVLSAPPVFVSFLLVYMTYCSLDSCSLFHWCCWVLRCPGSPLSIYDSAFFLGFTSSSFTASAFLLVSS